MPRHTPVAAVQDDRNVKREIRLGLFEKALHQLLSGHEDRDFVIFELRRSPDAYVQYMFHDQALLGEVGSKGWIPEGELLDKERVSALGCLGFEGGGLQSNFARDHLPQEPRWLACMTELLFGAAFRPERDFDVTVVTRSLIEAEAAQRRSLAVDA